MTQGVVSSRMPTLPVVHLAHVVETGAWFAVGGVVVGAVLMVLIRRRGWSWTCGLPLLTPAPFAWLLGWRAGIGYYACALAAVGGGACRHHVGDMTITEWIGRQGAVRAEHVMTRFSIGRTATYRRVHELAEFGLVLRHRLLYNDGGLLTATAEGLRCAGLDRLTPARISLALVPHMIASAALAAELEPQLDDEALLSDREHRAAENAGGQPIASAIIGSHRDGHRGLHRPDFALVGRDGDEVIAVEVEPTLKNRTRLERILRGYLRNQNVTVVRYHAAPPIADR